MFSIDEYQDRLESVQKAIDERDLDGIIVTDPANLLYLTGYDAWSFYVPQALLVLQGRDRPIWIGREMDANAARQTTWLDDEDIQPYGEEYLKTVTDQHPMDAVASTIDAHGYNDVTLGAEMGAYYFTARDYRRLVDKLPSVEFVDATNLVNQFRLIKSEDEIELIRKAARITDNMIKVAVDAISPGVPQNEVVAEIYDQMIRGTDEYGGDYSSNPPMMPAGKGTNTPHLTWTDDDLESDQPVILEIGGCKKRYHSPIARTVYVGDPPSDFKSLHEVTVEGLEAALEFIEPGVTAEEVAFAYQDVISEYGYEKSSRLGYRAGSGEYPPSWGEGNWERIPSLQPGDTTVLEPNMTFHVIAGMWEAEYGVEVSETIQATEDGVHVFGNTPRELFVA